MHQQTTDVTLRVGCDPQAPGAARRALIDEAGLDWLDDDVMLVTSELVTNAVLHSGGSEYDEVYVEMHVSHGTVSVCVTDPGTSGGEAEPTEGEAPYGGFGLKLVDQLAERWGSERAEGGRLRVWAEVPLSSQHQA